jgi:hypothetical protein
MASEGSERKSGSQTNVRSRWWVACHPKYGLGYGLAADGATMLRLYEDLDSELIEDIKQLNEEEDNGGWKAVRVMVEILDE